MLNRPMWLGYVLMALACSSCGSQRCDHIHYVLPNGYRGAFLIYNEREDGIELRPNKGQITCVIPNTGVLRVKGKGPFYEWHSTTASFANGVPIPIASESED